jgi:uncharacterized cupin superfamily protein
MAKPANVFTTEWDFAHGGVGLSAVAKQVGSESLGATVYELEPGARWADLHVHYANEELIVVLSGSPTPYTLHGGRKLAAGKVVACRRGKEGAHRLENESEESARVLIVSTMLMPEVVEYPERDHLFVMTEAPYTDGANDPEAYGRILRVFERAEGRSVPPDD